MTTRFKVGARIAIKHGGKRHESGTVFECSKDTAAALVSGGYGEDIGPADAKPAKVATPTPEPAPTVEPVAGPAPTPAPEKPAKKPAKKAPKKASKAATAAKSKAETKPKKPRAKKAAKKDAPAA
jgi:outer membrane biosynthesis protein TonB